MSSDPYQSPREKSEQPPPNLWPRSRTRRERMVGSTIRAWLMFGLRAIIFVLVVSAIVFITRAK
jgi:hypothetical protein